MPYRVSDVISVKSQSVGRPASPRANPRYWRVRRLHTQNFDSLYVEPSYFSGEYLRQRTVPTRMDANTILGPSVCVVHMLSLGHLLGLGQLGTIAYTEA